MVAMSSLGRIHERSSVIDLGCGSGVQTKMLATSMKKDAVLYACDFSPQMIECLKNEIKYNFDDFNSNVNNHFETIDINQYSKYTYLKLFY